MNYLKKYGLRLLYTILSILILLLLITALYYFDFIGSNTYKIFKIIIILVSIFISSFILGKNADSKGYREGIILAAIIVPLFLICAIIVNQTLKLKSALYYLILTMTSVLGGMVGISRKKE